MKKGMRITAVVLAFASITMVSCKKDECHECHYDGPNGEVELGEKCGADLEDAETNGLVVDGVVYEVHCHGH